VGLFGFLVIFMDFGRGGLLELGISEVGEMGVFEKILFWKLLDDN